MVDPKTRSIYYLLLAAAGYGGLGIFSKLLLGSSTPIIVTTIRIFFMVLALLILIILTGGLKHVKIKKSEIKNYILLGFGAGAYFLGKSQQFYICKIHLTYEYSNN